MSVAAFRVDGSGRIGSGHVMRCLALADGLAAAGWRCVFATAVIDALLAERIKQSGHRLIRLSSSLADGERGPDWDQAALARETQLADAEAFLAELGVRPDWVIVDHYQLDATWEQTARAGADKLMVIDDLANRPHDCDLLLDQSSGRSARDYRDLVPPTCRLLTGPMFAPLRPEFAALRPQALERRRRMSEVERVLISLGAADLGGYTLPATTAARAGFPDAAIDVVLGPSAETFGKLQALDESDPRVRIHPDPDSMARLMADADIAVGAGGTTSWERCCLGLPTVLIALADNQRFVVEQLGAMGAAIGIDDLGGLEGALRQVARPELRESMAAAAFALCDGEGVERVRDVLDGRSDKQEFVLRAATEEDSETLWLWRNDPATRRESTGSDPIAWQDHCGWFERLMSQGRSRLLIAEASAGPVGMVRLDPCPEPALLVNINIAPTMRGQGVGERLLGEAVERYGDQPLRAQVREANHASRRIFDRCGFVVTHKEGAFLAYERVPQP